MTKITIDNQKGIIKALDDIVETKYKDSDIIAEFSEYAISRDIELLMEIKDFCQRNLCTKDWRLIADFLDDKIQELKQ